MFPSSNNDNSLSYTNETSNGSFAYNENPNSIPEEPPLFLHFPSPFLDNNDDIFTAGHGDLAETETNMGATNTAMNINIEISSNTATEPTPSEATPKKRRNGKKDRHSKIYTAQGLRDRRMRLSLQIARKFFDLQDMLGFDKASKTIEWLFSKSKKAIKEVTGSLPKTNKNSSSGAKSESFIMSECEVESGTEEIETESMKGVETLVGFHGGERKCRKTRKAAYDPLARESRDKARARARERTRGKMMIRRLEKSKQCNEANPNIVDNLGSSCPFETEELSTSYHSQEKNSHSLTHQLANVQIIDKFLGTTSSSTSNSIFDYLQKNDAVSGGLDCFGNWELGNARINSNINYGMIPLTGNIHGQNTSSIFMTTSNIPSQHQEK